MEHTMRGKRTRGRESHSFGDVVVVSRPRPPPEVNWDDRTSVVASPPLPSRSVMSVSSLPPLPPLPPGPVSGAVVDCGGDGAAAREGQNGYFLERCRFCKKKLKVDDDVYMYGYLTAFCSLACRETQILVDKASQEVIKR